MPAGVMRLRPEDEEQVVDLVSKWWAGGTTGTDPTALWDWVLGPHLQGQWEDPLRVELVAWVARWMFRELMRLGGFALGVRESGGKLVAVCVACPGAAGYGWAVEAHTQMQSWVGPIKAIYDVGIPPCSKEPVRGNIGKGIEKRLYSLWRLRELPAKNHVGEHIYIGLLACRPNARGFAGRAKILQAVAQIADDMELACYMETSTTRDLGYYRQFAFSEHGPFEVGPTSDVDNTEPFNGIYALVRPAMKL